MDEHSPTPPALVRLSEGWCPLDGHGRLGPLGRECDDCYMNTAYRVSWWETAGVLSGGPVIVVEVKETLFGHVAASQTRVTAQELVAWAGNADLLLRGERDAVIRTVAEAIIRIARQALA